MIDMTHYDGISELAVRTLGAEKVSQMSKPQLNAFNKALDRMLERHKTHQSVTPQEILGAYEMVVHHVLPTS